MFFNASEKQVREAWKKTVKLLNFGPSRRCPKCMHRGPTRLRLNHTQVRCRECGCFIERLTDSLRKKLGIICLLLLALLAGCRAPARRPKAPTQFPSVQQAAPSIAPNVIIPDRSGPQQYTNPDVVAELEQARQAELDRQQQQAPPAGQVVPISPPPVYPSTSPETPAVAESPAEAEQPGIVRRVVQAVPWWQMLGVAAAGGAVPMSLFYAARGLSFLVRWRRGERLLAPDSQLRSDVAAAVEKLRGGGTARADSKMFPVAERDGTEAYQLLELANLEGESPIYHAYSGLAARDLITHLAAEADEVRSKIGEELLAKLEKRINDTLRVTQTANMGA